MRLGRLGDAGAEIPVLVDDGGSYDLRPVVRDLGRVELAPERLDTIRAAHLRDELPLLPGAEGMRIAAPIAEPGTIVCIGMNYAAHAAESGSEPPALPIVFLKPSNTVAGPDDPVAIPRNSRKTDWEVELAVVIGTRAHYLDGPEQAAAHIAGFATANDYSEREWQLELSGGQWSKGKSAPGFTPIGPWLVTPDEVDSTGLRLRSRVNGELRQDSSTADLIFPVDRLIWELSQFMALDPGDVILTGTPEGVALSGRFPYLRRGDEVEVEIDGLGAQRQTLVGWDER
jgi:2,4-didehydro-3-deoxy-L-rhamnonate hydrolase